MTPTPTTPEATSASAAPAQAAAPARRPAGPMQRRRQKSRYGTQMEEKQNLKKIYGIREEQLRHYFSQAQRSSQETGLFLVSLLERRLDNAVFRAGWAPTRPAARQMSSHRLLLVNGHPVTVPSISLRVGDVVSVKENKRTKPLFENFMMKLQNVHLPSWIELMPQEFSFKVTALPTMEEAQLGVDIRAIVEYFAR